MRAQHDERVDAIAALVSAAVDDTTDAGTAVSDALDRLGVTGAARVRLADQVHRARGERARLRRREHELAALFSSARELAELRDSDPLLERLVQRAHQMMGADVTYLSEFDPVTRQLRVRTTSGSVSAAFQQLLVPPGRGLASVVVETRSAQSVLRYGEFRPDRHAKVVDDAVAAEGLVSLLGVPMVTDDDVLGVLFVATRTEHVFSPDEIALMSALADHASVVLQTARTLRNLRRSEDEARSAVGLLTEHLAERDRANLVHQELVQAVLSGHGYSPVAQTLASALGRPVAILDVREQVIAGSPLRVGEQTRAAIEESRRSGHAVRVDDGSGVSAVAAFTAGSQYFGAMLLGDGDLELGPVHIRTVERAAQVCALLALQQAAVAEAEQRVQNELVADILDAVPERRPDVARRAQRLGVTVTELDRLVLFAVSGEHRAVTARTLGSVLGDRALVGEYRGFVVVTYPSGRITVDAGDVRARTARSIGAPVLAVVPPAANGALPTAFVTAMRTARLLAALGVDDIVAATDDYLPYSAVLDADLRGLRSFLEDAIGPVRRYDAERGTDLLGTLRAFVRNSNSPTRTARALNFHTNTIIQRLDRLNQVLGPDWRDDERLFRIGIAVRLEELRERLVHGSGPRQNG